MAEIDNPSLLHKLNEFGPTIRAAMEKRVAEGESADERSHDFAPTHWSVVLAVGRSAGEQRAVALEALCRAYWEPLYAYVRRLGYERSDAEDLTQGFFAHLLCGRGLDTVSPARGKFRSFLLSSLKHFIADERDRAAAAKRGGDQKRLSFDMTRVERHLQQECVFEGSAEHLFDRRWAVTLLNHAFVKLQEELRLEDKAEEFAELSAFLSREGGAADYESAGAKLGLKHGAVAVAVHRLRLRYRELIRVEIAQTVAHPSEVAEEMRYLLELICR